MGNDPRIEALTADAELDCIGFYCPLPISMTREKIDQLEVGQILKVEADDPAADEDLHRWAKRIGHEVLKFEQQDGFMTFYIRKLK